MTSHFDKILDDIKNRKSINILLWITSKEDVDIALKQYHEAVAIPETKPPKIEVQITGKNIDLGKINIPLEVINRFPEDIARKYQMIVFEAPHASLIKVAVANPTDKKVREMLDFVKDKNDIAIEEYAVPAADILKAMNFYHPEKNAQEKIKPQVETVSVKSEPVQKESAKEEFEKDEDDIIEFSKPVPVVKSHQESVPEVFGKNITQTPVKEEEKDLDKYLGVEIKEVTDLEAIAQVSNIPKTLAAIISLAVRRRSSDIHIEPSETNLRVRYRVDGILRDIIKLPLDQLPAIVSRIKILSRLKIDESRVPQDGRFDVKTMGHEIDLRVSTLPTVNGEKVAMRILDKSLKLYTLEELGLAGKTLKNLTDNIDKPYGIVLSTGPTGSGKSTSLYAILNRISTNAVNIVTLEDPVEYEIPGINQCQIKPKVGFNFANGLRSILRQDPNIIMVGEIRDSETASLSTHAALTGHLVLSTLHTNDAAGALPRLMNMGIEPFLITSSINCIVGQRLVRKLCPKCKAPAHIPAPVMKEIEEELRSFNFPKPYKFYEGRGCEECDMGYQGRIGIFEVLPMTEKIEAVSIARRPSSEIKAEAIKEGMVTMKQDGLIKALKGSSTVNEVLRVVTI